LLDVVVKSPIRKAMQTGASATPRMRTVSSSNFSPFKKDLIGIGTLSASSQAEARLSLSHRRAWVSYGR